MWGWWIINRKTCAFIRRVAFKDVSGHRVLFKSVPENWGLSACGTTHEATSRISSGYRPHPEVRREGREPLPDHAGESPLHARLQYYANQACPDVQDGFRKGRGTRDQIANICWIIAKAREFQKNTYFCFIDYTKAFDCVDHNKLWKALKKTGIPDHLTCLLRNLYLGQEATVRTLCGTTDGSRLRKQYDRVVCGHMFV